MTYKITAPSRIDTTIKLPASKSISNRALIISALAGVRTRPQNISNCDDTEVILRALLDNPYEIDIKAAGTAMRFMTAYLAATPGEHVITGTERMKHRPIKLLVDALRYLGADIEYIGEEGFPPLKIRGTMLDGGSIEIPGNVSSQYISALLMIAPMLRKGLELHLTWNIISRPYIDLTIHTMHDYGARVEWTDVDTIVTEPTGYREREFMIENDWSGASYWYETLALLGDHESRISMPRLIDASRQGDSVVRYLFSMLGVKTAFDDGIKTAPTTVTLKLMHSMLPKLDFDFSGQPDLAPTFVVTCAAMGIPFHFTGLATLHIKESDRIEALKREMRKLGFVIREENGSELLWDGERCDATWEPIDTYEDHRMAMAFAPAAIKFPGLRINNPEVVTKSYPGFWKDMQQAGFIIEEE
ncbi:MAG: 3-phosphoshikimate 1-carboxyvinyltransferase [Prevotella sp.]|uniref:3-phosphoshikimate 1-carboxyvinyltransferase n=1 Tax=Prevotella sp. TaxID=59823 RepID=UPI002A2B3B7F|nr:3-phosphoshikimate 1-carboxyvinyltransferase [Prevotella sp.]MDD7317364.1 3-phosphoshikimate 1-carboxyvinyltransferase [Prevotellaceae bacterium]MDY4019462.1 3-phosphoshikimate 1-carboxyvinyltransferase [Prevotella sp.]